MNEGLIAKKISVFRALLNAPSNDYDTCNFGLHFGFTINLMTFDVVNRHGGDIGHDNLNLEILASFFETIT